MRSHQPPQSVTVLVGLLISLFQGTATRLVEGAAPASITSIKGPISGGSMATSSVVPAVIEAADTAIAALLNIATKTPGSPFEKRKSEELAFEGGRVFVKADGDAARGVPFADCSSGPTCA